MSQRGLCDNIVDTGGEDETQVLSLVSKLQFYI